MQKKQSLTIALFCFYTSIFSVSHAEDSISKHFGYGKIYAGIQAGWGKAFSLGIAGQGDGRNVEFVAMLPHIGMGLTDILGKDSWYQGNLDAILQGEFLTAYEPNSGYSSGGSFLLRYNFLFSKQWVPYLEIGGGVGTLDFDLRDQDDGLIFYPQAGVGLHYFLNDQLSADLGWRFHHMSNANTTLPNNSVNASLIIMGFSWYFD